MDNDIKKIQGMLEAITKTTTYLRSNNISVVTPAMEKTFREISTAISGLTRIFYGTSQTDGNQAVDALNNAVETDGPLDGFYSEFDKLKNTFESDISAIESFPVILDRDFAEIILTIKRTPENELYQRLVENLMKMRVQMDVSYGRLIDFYRRYSYFWGTIAPENNDFSHFRELVHELKEHVDKYEWLYAHLGDYRSKKVLYEILKFRSEFDLSMDSSLADHEFTRYFDLDLTGNFDLKGTVVDCGAGNGEFTRNFINVFNGFKKIYLYDIVPAISEKLEEEFKNNENIEVRHMGAGDIISSKKNILVNNGASQTPLSLLDTKNASLTEKTDPVPENTGMLVSGNIVTLDHDINEKVGFIKINAEGFEPEVIEGCKNHIKIDKPIIAVDTSHRYSHIWEIPEKISKIKGGYKFYMRYYGAPEGYMTTGFVLYAL